MDPVPDNSPELTREEIDQVIAEYRHQQMMEHLVGPMVSMIVHVVLVIFAVFFISLDGPPEDEGVEITMARPDEMEAIENLEDFEEPPPEEMEIPEIEVAAPDASSAPVGLTSFADVGGQTFSIASSSSPYKIKVPAGGGVGVGFGSGGGGTGIRPANAMAGRLYVLRSDRYGRTNALGVQELKEKTGAPLLNVFYSDYVSPYLQFLERQAPADPSQNWFTVPKHLYSKAFYLPRTDSKLAPRLYGASDYIGPLGGHWLAIYRGIIPVKKNMRFRFHGIGDNLLYVLINHQLVHDGCLNGTERLVYRRNNPAKSLWFDAKQDEKLLVEIIVGESWGGVTYFDLWIEMADQPGKKLLFTTDQLRESEKAQLIKQGVPAERLTGGMINPTATDKFLRRIREMEMTF